LGALLGFTTASQIVNDGKKLSRWIFGTGCNGEDFIDCFPVVIPCPGPHGAAKRSADGSAVDVAIPRSVQFCGKQVTMVLVAIIRQDCQCPVDCE
jgi:hypothetical protein